VTRRPDPERWNPLVGTPVATLGWAFATCVGLVLGATLSTGPMRVVDGLVVCSGLPRWAFGRGGTCVGSVYLTRDNDGDRVLRHERRHIAQWKRYGMLMPLLYALEGRDATRNRFEIEAGLEDGGYV
jgi:hypothetical protein